MLICAFNWSCFFIELCKINYKKREGIHTFLSPFCSCPLNYEKIDSDFDSTCTCFLKDDLESCRKEPKCEVAPSIGCVNK